MSAMLFRTPFGVVLAALCLFTFVYILAPLVVIVATSFGTTGYIVFPPEGFTLRAYGRMLQNPLYVSGFLTSLMLASIATLIALPVALPASYAIARLDFPGARAIESLFLSPLVLPGLVSAVALTIFLSRTYIPAGSTRLVLAHISICVPCVIRVMIPAFQRLDRSIEEAAMNLGASPVQTFLLVSLPVVRPALLAAAALSFVLSFDEVDRSVFLAAPRNPPLTVVLYTEVQNKFEPTLSAVAASLILIAAALAVVIQFARRR